ncbi:MAG: hypothetical protein AAFR55_09965, partial [Pseudomonadota bacterium]
MSISRSTGLLAVPKRWRAHGVFVVFAALLASASAVPAQASGGVTIINGKDAKDPYAPSGPNAPSSPNTPSSPNPPSSKARANTSGKPAKTAARRAAAVNPESPAVKARTKEKRLSFTQPTPNRRVVAKPAAPIKGKAAAPSTAKARAAKAAAPKSSTSKPELVAAPRPKPARPVTRL